MATDERVGRVEVALVGDFSSIGIGAAAWLYGRPVVARVAALPFARSTIALIEAHTSGIELRAVHASLPHALLDMQLDARLARSGSLQGEMRTDYSVGRASHVRSRHFAELSFLACSLWRLPDTGAAGDEQRISLQTDPIDR